jgi:hypothetical protein
VTSTHFTPLNSVEHLIPLKFFPWNIGVENRPIRVLHRSNREVVAGLEWGNLGGTAGHLGGPSGITCRCIEGGRGGDPQRRPFMALVRPRTMFAWTFTASAHGPTLARPSPG